MDVEFCVDCGNGVAVKDGREEKVPMFLWLCMKENDLKDGLYEFGLSIV